MPADPLSGKSERYISLKRVLQKISSILYLGGIVKPVTKTESSTETQDKPPACSIPLQIKNKLH